MNNELLFDILNSDKSMLETLYKIIEKCVDEDQLTPITEAFYSMMERRTKQVGELLESVYPESE